MRLVEISHNLSTVYRTIGVPVKNILRTTGVDFHDPEYPTTHGGIWVAKDKVWVEKYGSELGDVDQLSVPILMEYRIPTSAIDRPPDSKGEGDAYKLPLGFDLGFPFNVQMFIGRWQPLDRSVIADLPSNPELLQQILDAQEYFPPYGSGSVSRVEQLDIEWEFAL